MPKKMFSAGEYNVLYVRENKKEGVGSVRESEIIHPRVLPTVNVAHVSNSVYRMSCLETV